MGWAQSGHFAKHFVSSVSYSGRSPSLGIHLLVAMVVLLGFIPPALADQPGASVSAWGWNAYGQLGDGTTISRTSPVSVPDLMGAVALAGGYGHSAAIMGDGTAWTWGRNDYGQLGDGGSSQRHSPVQVSGLVGGVQVACGYYHTVALKSNGTLWAWGRSNYGQLGNGSTLTRYTPFQVLSLNDATGVAAGYRHTAAVTSSGSLWTWGDNSYGQLGTGSTTSYSYPVQANGLSNVQDVACGYYHTVALKSDGTVWVWGLNDFGQLGDGTTATSYNPVQVSGLGGVVGIAAGYKHTAVVRNDGTIWAWGYNIHGQLGDGTTDNRLSPIQVSNVTGATTVCCGDHHTLALANGGTLWAWGNNGNGQLGDGTTTDRPSPVSIDSAGIAIAAGYAHSLSSSITLTADVSPPDGGTVTVVPDKMTYDYGELVTLTAQAAPGHVFVNWLGLPNGVITGQGASIQFSIIESAHITACFERNDYTVTVSIDPPGTGTVTIEPDKLQYDYGDIVTLTAEAQAPGYIFNYWGGLDWPHMSGEGLSGNSSISFFVQRDMDLTAYFQTDQHTLTTEVIPPEGGSIAVDPDKPLYNHDELVILRATPNAGFVFRGWSGFGLTSGVGQNLGSSVISFRIQRDSEAVADFRRAYNERFLTYDFSAFPWQPGGDVAPTVEGYWSHYWDEFFAWQNSLWWWWQDPLDPPAIAGPIPWREWENGAAFFWKLAQGQSSSLTLDVLLDHPDQIVFNYLVRSVPDGDHFRFFIDDVEHGSWSGDTGWQEVVYPLSAGPHTLQWRFSKEVAESNGYDLAVLDDLVIPGQKHTLEVSVYPEDAGTATVSPQKELYDHGEVVTLQATPAAGYVFDQWYGSGLAASGAAQGLDSMISFTVIGDSELVAIFKPDQHTLATYVNPEGSATLTVTPAKSLYDDMELVTITAQPAPGWAFDGWSGRQVITWMGIGGGDPWSGFSIFSGADTSVDGTISFNIPNDTEVIAYMMPAPNEDFETGDFNRWPWVRGGHRLPVIDPQFRNHGRYAARLGGVDEEQYCSLTVEVDLPVPNAVSFHYAVDSVWYWAHNSSWPWESDSGWDGSLVLFVDGQQVWESGSTSRTWRYAKYMLSAGPHTLQWQYIRPVLSGWDSAFRWSWYSVEDAAWLDDMIIPGVVTHTVTAQANPPSAGTVLKIPSQAQYDHGQWVTLQANPAPGWFLDHWDGDNGWENIGDAMSGGASFSGRGGTISFQVTTDMDLTAQFLQGEYTLVANAWPYGAGSVAKSPDKRYYAPAEQVTLTAEPADGYFFSHWLDVPSGEGSQTSSTVAFNIYEDSTVTAVFRMDPATAASGRVVAWGWNYWWQLGDGTDIDRHGPVYVQDLSGAVAVDGGFAHSLALKNDGTVWAWGDNWYGQLGDGTMIERPTPVRTQQLSSIVAVSAGGFDNVAMPVEEPCHHSVALRSDGTVWAWGSNDHGQLGDGTTIIRNLPVQVVGPQGSGFLTDVVAVSAGRYHTLAVRSDGSVWAWGNNDHGQLGDGTWKHHAAPVRVVGPDGQGWLADVVSVGAGSTSSYALKVDGTVWWWGGAAGLVGWPSPAPPSPPSQVLDLSGVVALSAAGSDMGDSVRCVQSDGTVWQDMLGTAWKVPELIDIGAVACGGMHYLALSSDGTVWADGSDFFGELGDGPVPGGPHPMQVIDVGGEGLLTNVVAIGAGGSHSLAIVDVETYTLAVDVAPTGSGNVVRSPDLDEYEHGELVELEAQATVGWEFAGWSGLPSGVGSGAGATVSFNITQDLHVTAQFAEASVQLVYGDHTGGDITGHAEGEYPLSSTVNLHAAAHDDYRFVRWLVNGEEPDHATDPDLSLTMDEDKTVEAVFAYQFTLTVINGSGSGTYDEGAEVQIVADWPPAEFVEWIGDTATVADVNSATTTIVVNGHYVVTAVPILTVTAEVEGDLDWVYQNTPQVTMGNGGHKIRLEVQISDPMGNSNFEVTVEKVPGSGSGEVTVEDDPEGDPLVKYVFGSLRTDGMTGTGDLTLRVTVTGNVAGQTPADVLLTVRPLGDIDDNGAAEPGDVSNLIMKLNGNPSPEREDREFDLDANGAAEPGDVQILINILNGRPVP